MSKRTVHTPPRSTIPAVGEGKRGEAGYLGYLLRQAAHAHRKRMDRALGTVGLTHPQFLVLTMIRAYPGCSNADIARLSMLTPQTVHAIIAALRERALVERQADPGHGRILNLTLTPGGQDLLGRARSEVMAVEAHLHGALSGAPAGVRRWLVRVAEDAPED